MTHINLPDAPGILAPMFFRPETARPLNELAEVLLRGANTLSRGERELIAAYVSRLNQCPFCWNVVEAVLDDPAQAPVSGKMRSLLAIARLVQQSGKAVTPHAVAAAKDEGATDVEIHDTVLIAAAFCMFNRYVDGLGTFAPPDRADYAEMGEELVTTGYAQTGAFLDRTTGER